MVRLTEEHILALMREEWDMKLKKLKEDTEGKLTSTDLVSPGLKVLHKKSRFRYTVHSVSKDSVILKTPEGETFLVDADKLEQDYVLS